MQVLVPMYFCKVLTRLTAVLGSSWDSLNINNFYPIVFIEQLYLLTGFLS